MGLSDVHSIFQGNNRDGVSAVAEEVASVSRVSAMSSKMRTSAFVACAQREDVRP